MIYIFWIVLILIIWFDTDAMPEWLSLINLRFIKLMGKFSAYRTERLKNPMLAYPHFLEMTYPNFLTRLIACPLCLGWWLSVIFYIFSGLDWSFLAAFYLAVVFIYYFLKSIIYSV